MKNVRKSTLISKSIAVAVTKGLIAKVQGADFEAIKLRFPARYAAPNFLTDLDKAADAVQALPEPQTRISPRKQSREELAGLVGDVLIAAQSLKLYIDYGYPAADTKGLYIDAAIAPNYSKARKLNWDSAGHMLNGMIAFVDARVADLTNKGSMPADFPAQLKGYWSTFSTLKAKYEAKTAETAAENDRVIAAINDLKVRVQNVCNDAKTTFAKDKAKRDSYSFSAIQRSLFPGGGDGGFRSGLFDALNQRPIEGGSVRTTYFNKVVFSGKDGRFVMHQLPAGTYTFVIEAKGYQSITVETTIKKGVMRSWPKIMMEKEAESVD